MRQFYVEIWTLTFQIIFVIQYVIVVINWPVDNFVNKILYCSLLDRLNGKKFWVALFTPPNFMKFYQKRFFSDLNV